MTWDTRNLISEYQGTLTVLRCWCGIQHAVPTALRDEQLRQFNDARTSILGIYCPLGHQHQPAGETRTQKLEKELAAKQAQLEGQRLATQWAREQQEHTERRRRAEKGAKTRLKRRAAAGVCPCCSRSFENLRRHMTTKHPGFAATADKEEA